MSHHEDFLPNADEELSISLEYTITLTWLRLSNEDLPSLIKQHYGSDLRSRTLGSLKSEIFQALISLLDEIRTNSDFEVLRIAFKNYYPSSMISKPFRSNTTRTNSKICPLFKQTGHLRMDDFLCTCSFLTQEGKMFMSQARKRCVNLNKLLTKKMALNTFTLFGEPSL